MQTIVWKARLFNFARRASRRVKPFLKPTGLGRMRAIQAWRRKGKRQVMRWLESGNLLLIEVDGRPMYIFNRPHFIGVHLSEGYEAYTIKLFKEAVKPGATVLDIGANVGYFSLIAAHRVGAAGKVYAFEPGPDNFEVLKRNIEINRFENITAVRKAVGDQSKTVMLTLAEDSDQHSLFDPPHVAATGRIPVECIALDDFLEGKVPDVIKLDVEGNELWALDGMQQAVANSRALTMIVEFNPACLHQAGVKAEALVSRLQELGFDLRVIDEHCRCLSPLTDDFLREIDTRPWGWFTNLYCTKGVTTNGNSR
jgi:FkbM family methyltransferase